MKTSEMWAVFDPEGTIMLISLTGVRAKHLAVLSTYSHGWIELERDGYTCRRVKVTIEEMKNDESNL